MPRLQPAHTHASSHPRCESRDNGVSCVPSRVVSFLSVSSRVHTAVCTPTATNSIVVTKVRRAERKVLMARDDAVFSCEKQVSETDIQGCVQHTVGTRQNHLLLRPSLSRARILGESEMILSSVDNTLTS